MFEDLVDFREDLYLIHFQSIFLDGKRKGPYVLMSKGPELNSLGSVDSSPKAPQELVGTCEGPSNVTGVGPFLSDRKGPWRRLTLLPPSTWTA